MFAFNHCIYVTQNQQQPPRNFLDSCWPCVSTGDYYYELHQYQCSLLGPAPTLTFLGIKLDSEKLQLCLPQAKLEELLMELDRWHSCRKTTKRKLLSLVGKLAFAAKAIPAGRLFTRRLIDLSTKVKHLHHHITLTSQARADIQWWLDFLPTWNGRAMFLDTDVTAADDIQLFTDASGAKGFGAYFAGDWLRGDWAPSQRLPHRLIQWQELFAIVVAAATWSNRLRGRKVMFNCDNKAVVDAWKRMSAKHPQIVALLRKLFLIAAQNNFSVYFKHVPGKKNAIADSLSRNQLTRFFSLAPQAKRTPTPLPDRLADL